MECPFCSPAIDKEESVVFVNDYCLFIQKAQPVLVGSGLIIPRAHRETVFDLSLQEWQATFDMLLQVKAYLDQKYPLKATMPGGTAGASGDKKSFMRIYT